jgi:hypothetical protein
MPFKVAFNIRGIDDNNVESVICQFRDKPILNKAIFSRKIEADRWCYGESSLKTTADKQDGKKMRIWCKMVAGMLLLAFIGLVIFFGVHRIYKRLKPTSPVSRPPLAVETLQVELDENFPKLADFLGECQWDWLKFRKRIKLKLTMRRSRFLCQSCKKLMSKK